MYINILVNTDSFFIGFIGHRIGKIVNFPRNVKTLTYIYL